MQCAHSCADTDHEPTFKWIDAEMWECQLAHPYPEEAPKSWYTTISAPTFSLLQVTGVSQTEAYPLVNKSCLSIAGEINSRGAVQVDEINSLGAVQGDVEEPQEGDQALDSVPRHSRGC